jgi:ECF sigma factor
VSDVTRILEAAQEGDTTAADQLLPLVYDELRRLAAHCQRVIRPGGVESFTFIPRWFRSVLV